VTSPRILLVVLVYSIPLFNKLPYILLDHFVNKSHNQPSIHENLSSIA